MSEFIKFSIPEDLRVLQDETIKKLSKSGKIKIGINEVTKTIERGNAKFVIIAEDVSPAEIVMHIPIISKDKKIPFSYSKTKEDLGKMVGISAKASCVAIVDAGAMQKELTTLIEKIDSVSGGKKVEAPKAEAAKKEKPKEAVKEAPKEKPKEAPKEAVKETPKQETVEKKEEKPKEENKE